MIRFKKFLVEKNAQSWIGFYIGALMVKVSKLEKAIKKENSAVERDKLIAQQNTHLSQISALTAGVALNDPVLLKKLRAKR